MAEIIKEITAPIRQLGQLRPSGTSAEVLFTTPYFGQLDISTINICNVSAAAVDISVFHDVDGSTADQTTALVYTHSLAVGAVMQIDAPIDDYQNAGTISVQVSVANAANFTVYGKLHGETVVPT